MKLERKEKEWKLVGKKEGSFFTDNLVSNSESK
jgi:hypothetical protein